MTARAAALAVSVDDHDGLSADPEPLPSWNDTRSKQAIVQFVEKVTREGSPDFVPVAERIAVFDNDGTLWSEQPLYFQALFAFDRVRQLAAQLSQRSYRLPNDHGFTKSQLIATSMANAV